MKRIISISICMVFLLSASTILPAEPMTFEEFKDEVRRIIRERNAFLLVHFIKGEYDKMPGKLVGYQTSLVTHDGEVISGEVNLRNYWEKVIKKLGGTELIIKDPELKFTKLELSLEPGETGYEDQFDYVAVEVTEFSFRVGEKKYTGLIDPTYRHKVRCTWH